MKQVKKSFYVSKAVLNTFDDLLKELGLVKQWWGRTFLLNEAYFVLWPFHGAKVIKQLSKNSKIGSAFLEQRQRGKVPAEFGIDVMPKDVTRTYIVMSEDDAAFYEKVCASFNVSQSALFEFSMTEAITRANSDVLVNKHRSKSKPLFTNKLPQTSLKDIEGKREELSDYIVKLQQVTLDELDKTAKLERMEHALFIADGLIPKSFQKKYRAKQGKKLKKESPLN